MCCHHEKRTITASKKAKIETITKSKNGIGPGEELPIFSAVSNVDLENLNLSITTNIKNLLTLLIQQITKCMDPKPNLNNDLSDVICDKDLK